MNRLFLLTVLSVAVMRLSSTATIINIPDDYPTIQEGIDASSDGDTVLVQPDTYYENINFNGHNIVLGSLFLMTGDTSYISTTIIDGGHSGSVITFESGEDSTSAISGFTLQNGFAYYASGGGIICLASSPVISYNIIQDNWASGLSAGGGGIYCSGFYPKIINNHIEGNNIAAMFSYGGAIYSHCLNSFIIGNRIVGNSSGEGGGIYCRNNATVANNTIIGNRAEYGAGIYCMDNTLIINNTITGNFAYEYGAGINCDRSNATIINSVINDNDPDGIFTDIYSILEIDYSNIQGGWEGEGNIDVDPLFRDPENGDFHLMSTECGDPYDSPCIDTGHPGALDTLLDCSWGLGTEISDMGAYGGGDWSQVGVDDHEIEMPKKIALLQNYPNPFNQATTIRYYLPAASEITIEIYDLLGRRVETLFEGIKQAGGHTITWDAEDRPSGIYFYRIQAGEYTSTKKMALLR